MRNLNLIITLIATFTLTSCIIVDNTPGPHGRDGEAYFGVDYDYQPPYSYWDDNNAIPSNPILGQYYWTRPGIYNFEYFVNPVDYWYGTYEIRINRGGPGGLRGEPGYDGLDTYLMLICDPNGYHQHMIGYRADPSQPLVVEKNDGKYNYTITIQRGNINTRPAQQPKFIGSSIINKSEGI